MRGFCLFVFLFLSLPFVWAIEMDLNKGIKSQIPIAVLPFRGDIDNQFATTLHRDLAVTAEFRFSDAVQHDPLSKDLSAFKLAPWRKAKIDNVLLGAVTRLPSGQYHVQFQLRDTLAPDVQASILMDQAFTVKRARLSRLAHHVSDLVYEKLTGHVGNFESKVAMVTREQNQAGHTVYHLVLSDYDGRHPHVLMTSTKPLMSPSFSHDGRTLAYVSFEKRLPAVYVINILNGQRHQITEASGINGAPSFSPDGHQMAVVLSKTGQAKIYLLDLHSKKLKQLTYGEAIDTEPQFSHDGKKIVFTSNRGGSAQVYQIDLKTQQIDRLTFEGDYNVNPHLSPDGKYLAVMHRDEDRRLNIALFDLENSQVRSLTQTQMNRSATFSPNSRLLMYVTLQKDGYHLALTARDVPSETILPSVQGGEPQEPVWRD